MWFKNLQIYRLPAPWRYTAAQLEQALARQAFAPATSNELLRQGWAPPRAAGNLVHTVSGQFLLQLKAEKKLLPASVINQVAAARAAEMEEAQGFAPGKKAMKELKERVADELLPRAFSIHSATSVWIDPVNGWLVVDAASPSKADDVIKMLLKAVDRMPLESLRVMRSPMAVMTAWLETDEAPVGFTVDQDAELRATGESKAAVRYVKHALEVDDIRRHIAAGKQCKKLAMTWNDKISFVLDESLAIKSVKPLDVIKENDTSTRNDEERFDNDMMLMTGELAKMLADLVEALGGHAHGTEEVDPDQHRPAPAQRPVERPSNPDHVPPREVDPAPGDDDFYDPPAKDPQPGGALSLHDHVAGQLAARGLSGANAGVDTIQDSLYDQAVAGVRAEGRASISMLQNNLIIGYNRAARLIERMEAEGVVSAQASNGAREVLPVAVGEKA